MKKSAVIPFVLAALVMACNPAGKKEEKNSSDQLTTPAIDTTRLVTVTIHVGGMTCTGCENTIKGGISDLPGIAEVSASYTDSVATVTFDTLQTTISAIDSVIYVKGYTVLSPEL